MQGWGRQAASGLYNPDLSCLLQGWLAASRKALGSREEASGAGAEWSRLISATLALCWSLILFQSSPKVRGSKNKEPFYIHLPGEQTENTWPWLVVPTTLPWTETGLIHSSLPTPLHPYNWYEFYLMKQVSEALCWSQFFHCKWAPSWTSHDNSEWPIWLSHKRTMPHTPLWQLQGKKCNGDNIPSISQQANDSLWKCRYPRPQCSCVSQAENQPLNSLPTQHSNHPPQQMFTNITKVQ